MYSSSHISHIRNTQTQIPNSSYPQKTPKIKHPKQSTTPSPNHKPQIRGRVMITHQQTNDPYPKSEKPAPRIKSNLIATEYRKYKQLLHPHRRLDSPAFSLFVEDWDARTFSPGPSPSPSGDNKDHRKPPPRALPSPPLKCVEAVKRDILLASSSTGREGDSPVPRGMKVIELREPMPLDDLKEARKGGAVRYKPVAVESELVMVGEEIEDAPAGCRMVELREPVAIGKLVEKGETEMGKRGKKAKKAKKGGRTVRVGMSF